MFRKKTIKDIDLANKRAVVRVDFSVPVDKAGKVEDDFKIQAALPTIQYLLDQGCSLALFSHLGRPEPGQKNPSTSLADCARVLGELINQPVEFVDDALGTPTGKARVALFENLRYYAEEEANDAEFAKKLASNGEVYVNDAFAAAHRAHASLEAITKFLPAVAGFLVENEVASINQAMENPRRPVLAILSGLKMETKVPLIEKFINHADTIVVGGGVANTLLADVHFGGHEMGKSFMDATETQAVERIAVQLEKTDKSLILPNIDVAVGTSVEDSERREIAIEEVQPDDLILDFGAKSLEPVLEAITTAGTIIWNGPLGLTENPQFSKSSETVARAIAQAEAYSVIGGGDTAAFVEQLGLRDEYDHVSTGGGASLELMAGNLLPGIEALQDK